jgi:hypothetical protein
MRPDVAAAFDQMVAAGREAGLYLSSTRASARTPSRRACSPRNPTAKPGAIHGGGNTKR